MRYVIKSVLIGVASLTVVLYGGRSGYSLNLQQGQEIAKLSFEEPVRVGGPVWAHVELPNNSQSMVQYPVGVGPDNLGCHEFEVRRNGVLLPRIVVRYSIRVSGGLSCGAIGIPGRPMKHPGRLPLHCLSGSQRLSAGLLRHVSVRRVPGGNRNRGGGRSGT
jgi:hypothetical protein